LRVDRLRWQRAFDWLEKHPEVEDVVLSGGDVFNLSPAAICEISKRLLNIASIRRIRIATKGLAVIPSRFGRDAKWTDAILDWISKGREKMVQVCIHTHFNHPNEITWVTKQACELLFKRGATIRNQSVLLRGVNDDPQTMSKLIKRLSYLQIQPYYVYQHDMVKGAESYRTPLQTALDLEKLIRGQTAGFNMPTFVIDLPGGGGKRGVHSFESYDREMGVSVYRSPVISNTRLYRYYDPIRTLHTG
jgi:lysine 2,3-aminomutase